jgi:hypothetical protein
MVDSFTSCSKAGQLESLWSAVHVAPLSEIGRNGSGLAFGNPTPIVGDVVERIDEMGKAFP